MIPDFQTAMLPLLNAMDDGNIFDTQMLRDEAIKYFRITDEEQHKMTPNGR